MIDWSALLAALGPALGKALYDVGEKIVFEPLLEPAGEALKERMLRGYKARVDEARLRGAVEAAARATGQWEDLGEDYRLKGALHRLAEGGRDDLRRSTVAAALAMTDEAPEQVPDELRQALHVEQRHRPDLAASCGRSARGWRRPMKTTGRWRIWCTRTPCGSACAPSLPG